MAAYLFRVLVDWIGGNCPVRAEGSVDGKRFYFRARGKRWQFHVADDIGDIFYFDKPYGEGEFDAGWMSEVEALSFIDQAIDEFRACVKSA